MVDVKTSAIKAWVATMVDQEVGAASIEQAFGVLRGVMDMALEDNRVPRNPCDSVKLPRHTAASLAVSAGANVKALQRMRGHAKASMTLDVYGALFDDDLDGVVDGLDAAMKSAADSLRIRAAR